VWRSGKDGEAWSWWAVRRAAQATQAATWQPRAVHPCAEITHVEVQGMAGQATPSSGTTHPMLVSVRMDSKQGKASAKE
jgi:hypothetical protein